MTPQADRELLRLHRRACTDFAARMRLPAWEHLAMPLAPPLGAYTVAQLLGRAADGNLAAAAEMIGQPKPPPVRIQSSAAGAGFGCGIGERGRPDPTQPVIESVRTVLAVAAGLTAAPQGDAAAPVTGKPAPEPHRDRGRATTGEALEGSSGPRVPVSEGAGFSPRLRHLLWTRVAELTVLGYDLQQAIGAGAGLDELLVDRILAAAPAVSVWPGLERLPVDLSTPPMQRLLAMAGRPAGRWVDAGDPNCGTGQC